MGRSTPVKWEVREEVTEVSDLYATYAYDPKTASDEPRVILEDSDLIKISIADSGRDKRTGVLIKGDDVEHLRTLRRRGYRIGLRLVIRRIDDATIRPVTAQSEKRRRRNSSHTTGRHRIV